MPAQQAGISWSAAGAVHCPSQPGILDRGSCSAQPGATPVWREQGATAAQPGRECDQPANAPKQRRVKRAKTAAHLADAHGTEELAAQPGAATRRHALLNDGNLHIVQAGVGREWAVSGMAAAWRQGRLDGCIRCKQACSWMSKQQAGLQLPPDGHSMHAAERTLTSGCLLSS